MGRIFADTSQLVEDELIRRLGHMPPWHKLEMVAQLNSAVREMMLAGLRHQYPKDSPEQQYRRLLALLHFGELASNHFQLREGNSLMQMGLIEVMIIVADTFDRLEVEYVIGGSIASAYYGIGRSTLDVDFIAAVQPELVAPLVEILSRDFYLDEQTIVSAVEAKSSFNLIHLSTMYKVYVFIPGTRDFDRLQLQRRVVVPIGPDDNQRANILTPVDVILAKLDWYNRGNRISDRQWQDILGVLLSQQGRLNIRYPRENAEALAVSDLLEKAFQESETG